MSLQLYDRVALRASFPEHALRAGDVDTEPRFQSFAAIVFRLAASAKSRSASGRTMSR